jgi:hypothetical protein
MLCSSYDVDISIGAGLEAQIGLGKLGLSLASPKKILYDKKRADPRSGLPADLSQAGGARPGRDRHPRRRSRERVPTRIGREPGEPR